MDENNFIKLLQKEEGKLFRIAWAILGQESDAWDALQETVEHAWHHRKELRGGDSSFPAWIRRIVVNRSLNVLRKQKRIVTVDPMKVPDIQPAFQESNFEAQYVWEVVKSLDTGHRQVVVLRYLGDLSLKDIALELDIPLGTVKSRLNRALTRLREKLKEDERRVPHDF